MYETFELVLMLNHACNLRCAYCYTGAKFWRSMPEPIAFHAVDRAIASLESDGTLHLGFFGGEPLLEAGLMLRIANYASNRARQANVTLLMSVTTNGTLSDGNAWQVLTMPRMRVTVSHDGLPWVHDKHRSRTRQTDTYHRLGSAAQVIETIRSLMDVGKKVRVSMVVRPDTA